MIKNRFHIPIDESKTVTSNISFVFLCFCKLLFTKLSYENECIRGKEFSFFENEKFQ